MDREFKTTFIPKKNLSNTPKVETQQTRARKSFFGLIATLLFISALVSTAGVYLYKARLATVLNSRIDSINRAEKAFEPSAILELKKLDIRLSAGTELLRNHVAISDFLQSLAESTLPDVRFTDMSFKYDAAGSVVTMTGESRGYLQIAQQSDVFATNRYIRNHIFSNFALTDTGRITFSLDYTLDPTLLVFGRTVENTQLDPEFAQGLSNIIIEDPNAGIPGGVDINFN